MAEEGFGIISGRVEMGRARNRALTEKRNNNTKEVAVLGRLFFVWIFLGGFVIIGWMVKYVLA